MHECGRVSVLTPRLRATLLRICGGLEEYCVKGAPPSGPSPIASHLNSGANLCGLRERVVALESLGWVGEVMRQAKPQLHLLLPPAALPSLDHFYARTVDAVPDLEEHVLKTLSRLLLALGAYADRISNVRWDAKEVGLEHSQ